MRMRREVYITYLLLLPLQLLLVILLSWHRSVIGEVSESLLSKSSRITYSVFTISEVRTCADEALA
jgi:hypothetical protein